MARSPAQLREDALRIWQVGLAAVRSPRLLLAAVEVEGASLRLGEESFDLLSIDRIAVVGGGKAAAGMALAFEQALGPNVIRDKRLFGVVNVPADCLLPTDAVTLHPGRPAGLNEPTEAGVVGARQMLNLVSELGPHDLCVCLLSGGASALLPCPLDGFALADKITLTRELSARGATIEQLNAVRRELSEIKGGGLARACRAGELVSLIISDVPGDDLATIGSGPTVLGASDPEKAIAVLEAFDLSNTAAGERAIRSLDRRAVHSNSATSAIDEASTRCEIHNIIIGNNATAVDAAGVEAERLGYSHAMVSANAPEGDAEHVAHKLVEMGRRMRSEDGPDCLITGGEPTVKLAPEGVRGRGGRNQQLCLAALAELNNWHGLALISGGTDGEDGPTEAAGALVDEQIAAAAKRLGLNPRDYLARNDAYTFFEHAGGLLKTGPTHTNVCDLRVLTVSR
jgi:glycerate 2-kinase